MNVAGPSRIRVITRKRAESTYERDLRALSDQFDLDELNKAGTSLTQGTNAGEPSLGQDVSADDVLQQSHALTPLNHDRILAEQIAVGVDEFGREFQRLHIVEAPRVGVRRTTRRRVSMRRNESREPIINGVVRSRTLISRSSLGRPGTTTFRMITHPTGHNCVICQDPIYGMEIRAPCGHYYDISCITDLFQSAIRDETLYPPRCCRKKIPFSRVRPHLPQAIITALQEKDAEFSTLNRVYCSSRICNRFLGPLSKRIFIRKVYTCPAPNCGRRTCGKCRGQYAGIWKHVCLLDAATVQVLELGRTSGWTRCPGCSQMIELNMGCYHITCRCRTEFCYLCRARWKRCRCPQWDERRLLAFDEERVDAQLAVGQEMPALHWEPLAPAPAPAPAPVPAANLRRRERVVRRRGPARRPSRFRPPTPSPPTQTPAATSTSAFVSSSSSSPSSPESVSEATVLPSTSASQSTNPQRQPLVHEMIEKLREDYECNHTHWRYQAGGGICQHCGHHFSQYLFHCDGCQMLACNRCM